MGVLRRLRLAGHPDRDARSRRLLDDMRRRGFNHDPRASHDPADGWQHDDHRRDLPPEAPGPPVPGGSWEVARRLMAGYEFADPSIAHAIYDPDEPLDGRTMLLELRLWGAVRIEVGVRVVAVYDEERELDGRRGRVWGWAYRTLEGHVEQGCMDWQVWKWADTGAVEFRVHAWSKRATDRSRVVQLGFRLFGRREQAEFLAGTGRRMAALTAAVLDADADPRAVAERCTVHRRVDTSPAHDRLLDRLA